MTPARPETPARLEHAALAHLRRFPASSADLRRILERRIARAEARGVGGDRDALTAAIADIIERFTARGLLDDAALARGLARSLRGRGLARRAIEHRLRAKGLAPELIRAAVAEVDDGADSDLAPDLLAAWRLARRRRLGPFCRGDRAERRGRDLAALGRAGFGFEVARTVVDATEIPTLPD